MSIALLVTIVIITAVDFVTVRALDAVLPDFKSKKLLDYVTFTGVLIFGLLFYRFCILSMRRVR